MPTYFLWLVVLSLLHYVSVRIVKCCKVYVVTFCFVDLPILEPIIGLFSQLLTRINIVKLGKMNVELFLDQFNTFVSLFDITLSSYIGTATSVIDFFLQ